MVQPSTYLPFLLALVALAPATALASVEASVDAARDALLAGDLAGARAAVDAVEEEAPASPGPVPPEVIARYWYYRGVVERSEGQGEIFFDSWRQAMAAAPDLAWEPGLLPDEELQAVFEALRYELPERLRVRLPALPGTEAWVDGRPAESQVLDGRHLFQVRCPEGAVKGRWADAALPGTLGDLCASPRATTRWEEVPALDATFVPAAAPPVATAAPPPQAGPVIRVGTRPPPDPLPAGLAVSGGLAGLHVARIGSLDHFTPEPTGGGGLQAQGAWDQPLGPGLAARAGLGVGVVGWPGPTSSEVSLERAFYVDLRPRLLLGAGPVTLGLGPTWRVTRSRWVGVDCPDCVATLTADDLATRPTRQTFSSAGLGMEVSVPVTDQLSLLPQADVLVDGIYVHAGGGVAVAWRP